MNRRKFLVSACAVAIAPALPPQILENHAIFRQAGHPWTDSVMDEIYSDISSMFNQLMQQGVQKDMKLTISAEFARLLESEHG